MRLARFVVLCFVLSMAFACEGDPDRCKALRRSIEAKERALPRACQSDLDCLVVSARPTLYVASSRPIDDAELAASVASYREECDASEPIPNVFQARCLNYAADDAPSTSLCTLLYGELVIDHHFTLPELPCNCAQHTDCSPQQLCRNQCYCEAPCHAACKHAESCGEDTLASLGLGTNLQTCIAVCEVNYADADLQSQIRCLSDAACEQLGACLEP